MADYTFGIATPIESAYSEWLIQSETHNTNAQEALALNNSGEPVKAHYYQRTDEMSLEAIVPTGSTPPVVGGTFKYNSKVYYVTGATQTLSNSDFEKYSISAKRFVTTNLPSVEESVSE